jgi:endonuclease/exonuclease/phosphatase family metal-dependent hydrolase
MSTSIREIARHLEPYPPASTTLRTILKQPTANLRLHLKTAPFSVMCHNMGLLPFFYKGTNRKEAINELVSKIQLLSPDVVGLCEVFVDSEREDLAHRLKHLYPYSQDSPDDGFAFPVVGGSLEDGGLLLLSKHPIESSTVVFDDEAGVDDEAAKGIIYARVKPPGSPVTYKIFFTHTQDIAPAGGREALYKQLAQLNMLVEASEFGIPPSFLPDRDSVALIIGDLNIPGGNPGDYRELLNRLRKPADLWIAKGNSDSSGFTTVSDNNFFEDEDDNPRLNQRLDYVLMRASSRFIPIVKNIEVLRFKHRGRFISDHFGLHAQFETLVQVDR